MKYKVKTLKGLEEDIQKLYKADGDEFVLTVSGMPDFSAQDERIEKMDAEINELLGEKKTAKAEATAAKKLVDEAAHKAAETGGDIEALNASWQKKFDDQAEASALSDSTKDKALNTITVGAAANSIASELSLKGSESVLLPHINRRLKVELVDGVAKTIVLDANGKPSAQTIDELKTEFRNNAAFAPLIAGSNAGGGGTGGENNGGGAAGKTITRNEFDNMGAGQRMDFVKDGGLLTDSTH
jgi:hypothetical protein